jgi:uncharacterized membrane protein YfcA
MNQSSRDDTLLGVRPSPSPGRGAVSSQSSRDKRRKRSLPGSSVREEGRAISGAAPAARTSDGARSTTPDTGPVVTRVTIDLACLTRLTLAATGVGLLTGFFGVGGGFLVVPTLVLVLGMPIRVAVGTSLVVIAVNSATALAARSGSVTIDPGVILPFAAAAAAALAAIGGGRLSARATPETLRRAFAVLLIAVAIAMGTRSLLTLT